MNYRKFYEEILNCKIPKGWDIHHLDENNKNNDIYNLVAVPKKTHQEYHQIKNQLSLFICTNKLFDVDNNSGYNSFFLYSDLIKRYTPVYKEILDLLNYRDFKMGIKPNFNNKNYY